MRRDILCGKRNVSNFQSDNMKLKNIKLKTFLALQNTTPYDIWFDKLPAKNELNGKKGNGMFEWTFAEVAYLRKLINDFNIENLKKIYNVCFPSRKILNFELPKRSILEMSIFEVVQWQKFVIEQLEQIGEREQLLGSDDPIASMAGIERMSKFGYLNTTVPIAERYGFDPDEVANWKWIKVFNLAYYNKEKNEVDKKYAELKMDLNKKR